MLSGASICWMVAWWILTLILGAWNDVVLQKGNLPSGGEGCKGTAMLADTFANSQSSYGIYGFCLCALHTLGLSVTRGQLVPVVVEFISTLRYGSSHPSLRPVLGAAILVQLQNWGLTPLTSCLSLLSSKYQ